MTTESNENYILLVGSHFEWVRTYGEFVRERSVLRGGVWVVSRRVVVRKCSDKKMDLLIREERKGSIVVE